MIHAITRSGLVVIAHVALAAMIVGVALLGAASNANAVRATHARHAHSKWVPFRDVEGHTGCVIKVGATSRVRCADGFHTTS